eukprot:COSAG02_NODE_3322_length_6945_cov_10.766579_4_plen_240_part_00
MLSPSPPRSPKHEGMPPSRRRLSGASSARQGVVLDALERERQLVTQERLSWARFEGAVPEPSLVDATAAPYDRYSIGAGYTPLRPTHSGRRTRRSLEDELQATLGGRAPVVQAIALPAAPPGPLSPLGADGDALGDLDPFDQALFALSSELDPWASGQAAQLSMCDYSEFRFVAESFRRWRALAADERKRRREYSWALRSYKAAVKHHTRDLMAKGWVGWEVSTISSLQDGVCLRRAME